MKKILTIIGARPQIIKAAAVSRAIRSKFKDRLSETIVHTGQHYDPMMSQVFFDELEIPPPAENLMTGSLSHAGQTAAMMTGLEQSMLREQPHAVLLYGDTNSTLAGSLTASKLQIPVIHIEAGLRSFNKSMPEEINRITCDHVSTLLFVPTKTGMMNLEKEGLDITYRGNYDANHPGVFHCGDIMFDNALYYSGVNKIAENWMNVLQVPKDFILCTIHRDHNTDNTIHLSALLNALISIADETKLMVVLPVHPRTKNAMAEKLSPAQVHAINNHPLLKIIEPVSYRQMLELEKKCVMVLTDSGGVQKEAYFFKKPCVILRPETEWIELVESGSAKISGADEELIIATAREFISNPPANWPEIFGDGKSADFICETIIRSFPV